VAAADMAGEICELKRQTKVKSPVRQETYLYMRMR